MVNHSMSSLLKQIIAVYPEYEEEIIEIFHKDESFQELVNDFLFCERKLKRLQGSTKTKLASQYAVTLRELRDELLGYLKKQKQL